MGFLSPPLDKLAIACEALLIRIADSRYFVGMCSALILVDSFLRYSQLDKIPVFYVFRLVVHLRFIS